MEISTMTLGFIGLAAVAVTAIVLAVARPWRRGHTSRFVARSASSPRRRSWTSNWYASDPVLFVGGDVASADCGAGADGGGGSCA